MSGQPADGGLDLLIVGDCNPDVLVLGDDVTPAFGQQEKIVASMALVIGGSAAIMAVAASRLGLRVALCAAVGADPAGEFMLTQLAAEGVNTDAIVVRPGQATGMTVALSHGTDRAILTALGAMPTLTAADVDPALMARARYVHVSSYFLLERTLGPGLAALLERAQTAGATTSLDTNWDPAGLWGGDQLDGVLAATDLLLPNEAEARLISGEAVIGKAITALAARGPRVAVKRGALGARCFDGTGSWLVRPPDDPVVDATGAGDCFDAGVIAGLLRGQGLAEAVRLGCAVGTASTRGAGGTSAAPSLAAALEEAERVRVTRAED
jgi:sugar/nucleoside kinase (ribokinase family)